MREALGRTRISGETALATLPRTLCCPVTGVSPAVSAVSRCKHQAEPGHTQLSSGCREDHPSMARVWQRRQQQPGASLQRVGSHSSPSQNDESQAQRSFLLKRKHLNIQHNCQGGSMGTVQALTHAPATGGSMPQPQLMLPLPDSACPGPSPWPAGRGCVHVTCPGCRNASAQTVSMKSQLDLRFLPSEDSSPGHLRTTNPVHHPRSPQLPPPRGTVTGTGP